ncbi:hypothetical protein CYMTET_46469 [Cymbomonas tetramitiformis]|uniref:TFIIS central domain-containing protein n=1 Tax=Cymbomonas tetramitiformis TaxID=36881 RepID=A0AAE0BXN8_9CHLO|nr:hypothetical protein CYMTET_46469 [Cymbomonas tetramitiformis]
MLGCDYCDDWFHGECVGIEEDSADALQEYTCPSCSKRGIVRQNPKATNGDDTSENRKEVFYTPPRSGLKRVRDSGAVQSPEPKSLPCLRRGCQQPRQPSGYCSEDCEIFAAEKDFNGILKRQQKSAAVNAEADAGKTKDARSIAASRGTPPAFSKALDIRADRAKTSAIPRTALQARPENGTSTTTPGETVRGKVISSLVEAFTSQEHSNQVTISASKALVLAKSIEAALFSLFKEPGKDYRTRFRSLVFNLRDASNPELRQRVLSKELSPDHLCRMTSAELASRQLSSWRTAKEVELERQRILPDEAGGKRVRKTHKGEEVVEIYDEPVSDLPAPQQSLVDQILTRKVIRETTLAVDATQEGVASKASMFPAQLPDFSSVRVHAEASLPAFQSFSDFAEQPAKPDAASRAPLPECHSFQERAEQANGEAPSTSFLPKFHSFEERAEQANGEAPSTSTRYGRPNGSDASEDSADEMMTEVLEEMTSAHSREQRVEPLVPVKNHGETTSSAHPAPSAKAKRGWASRRTTTGAAEDRSAKASPAAAAGDEDTWTGKLQLPGKTSGLDVTMRCSGCNVDSAPSLGLPSLLQVKGRIRLSVLEGFVGSLKSKNTSRTLTVLRVQATEGASFKDTKRVLHMEATELSDQERAFVLEPFKGLELYLLPECPLAKSLDTGVGGGALIGILIRRKAAKRSKDLGGSSSPTSEFPRASSKSPSRGKSPTAHTAVSKDPRLSRSEQQPLIADPSPRTTPPYTTMRPSACPRDPPASTSPMPNSSESSTPEVEVQEAKPWSGSTAVDRVVPGAGAVPGGRENTGAALDQSAASALNDLLALVGGVDTHMSTSSTAPPSDAGGLETAQMPLAPLMLGSQQAEQRLPMSMKESAAAAPLCLQAAPSPSEAARALPVSEPLPNALNAATPPYSAATRGEQQGSAFGGTSIAANWPHVGSANEAAVADDLPKFEFASDMVLRPGPPPGPPPPGSQPALHTVQHISAAGPHTAPPLHVSATPAPTPNTAIPVHRPLSQSTWRA